MREWAFQVVDAARGRLLLRATTWLVLFASLALVTNVAAGLPLIEPTGRGYPWARQRRHG